MRNKAAAGFLLFAGLILMWAGFAGRAGVMVAAVLAPDTLILPDDPALQSGG